MLLLDLVRQKKQAENEQKKVRESETRQMCFFVFVKERSGEVRTILYRKLESGRWLCSRSRRRKQPEGFRFLSV